MAKKEHIRQLKDMNAEAEKLVCSRSVSMYYDICLCRILTLLSNERLVLELDF